MKFKERLRWATVLLFGGWGIYLLAACLRNAVNRPGSSWGIMVVEVIFGACFCGLPLAVAYLVYLRRYRPLARVGVAVGTLALLGELSQLCRYLGGDQFLRHTADGPIWRDLAGIALLIAPFWLAGLFCKHASRLIDRRLPEPATTPEQEARAVRWQRWIVPIHYGILTAVLVLAEVMVWGAVVVFLGALGWVWMNADQPYRVDGGLNPFSVGFIGIFASLGMFVVGWIARKDWSRARRDLSERNEAMLTNPSESRA